MRNTDRGADDDAGMRGRPNGWDDRQVTALMRGPAEPADADLVDLVDGLRLFAAGDPPTPSPALAAMLDGAITAPLTARRLHATPGSNRRRGLRAVVLVLSAGVSFATAGAAANALPGGAQRTAASVLNTLTPFHFPMPAGRQPATSPSPRRAPLPAADHPVTSAPSSAGTHRSGETTRPALTGGRGGGSRGAGVTRDPRASSGGRAITKDDTGDHEVTKKVAGDDGATAPGPERSDDPSSSPETTSSGDGTPSSDDTARPKSPDGDS